MTERDAHLTIKQLPPELRPRERLVRYGASSLSNAELLAIVLGTGAKNRTAIQLSAKLLVSFETLGAVSSSTVEELCDIDGIGEAKAAKLLASLELGKRVCTASPSDKSAISSPQDVADLLMGEMRYLDREHFKALVLDTKHQVLRVVDISIGSLNSSIVHPRELYKKVIRHNGAAVIVAHNHPSGDPTPSPEDIAVTKRLVEAGTLLGVELLDHVILGDGRFVSLKEYDLM